MSRIQTFSWIRTYQVLSEYTEWCIWNFPAQHIVRIFKKYWIMWPQCAPSANTQHFLNFPKKATSKHLSHSFVATFKIYWVMWLQCTELAYFLHIQNILSPCNHILPEWLKENVLTMWSKITESGKLKTHVEYILNILNKLGMFQKNSQYTKCVQYVQNILNMCF